MKFHISFSMHRSTQSLKDFFHATFYSVPVKWGLIWKGSKVELYNWYLTYNKISNINYNRDKEIVLDLMQGCGKKSRYN